MDLQSMSITELKASAFDIDQDILRLQNNKQAIFNQLEIKMKEENDTKPSND